MKTLPMIAVLVPLLAACGSATRANSQAVETECSYELPAGADAVQMQLAVNKALEGKFDPCLGSVTGLTARNVALQRINVAMAGSSQRFSLVFSISGQQVDSSRNHVDYAHSQVDNAARRPRVGRQALGIGLIGRSVLATRETGCYALHVCSGGTFYSRRGLTAPSAAGAARSRAPPTLLAP